MQTTRLLRNSLTYYWRTNLAVILGVATAVSVLAGALLVGDSVRASLRDLAVQRLGKTDFVIGSRNFFGEEIASKLQSDERFKKSFDTVDPVILLDGSVHDEQTGKRAFGIKVYGVDERFWQFNGVAGSVRPPHGQEALLSPALAQELSIKQGEAIVVRVQKPLAIPIESLLGRKEDSGRAIRLTVRDTLQPNLMGEFSLQLSKGPVRAIFVPLDELQNDLQAKDKINTLLISAFNRGANQSEVSSREPTLHNLLKESATIGSLGLRLRWLRNYNPFLVEPPGSPANNQIKAIQESFSIDTIGSQLQHIQNSDELSIESTSAIINENTVTKIQALADKMNLQAAPVFTYLVNSIRVGDRRIPYSLATAIDLDSIPEIKRDSLKANIQAKRFNDDHIVLNEWAARDLSAKIGDKVGLEYFVWQDGGLVVREADFTLAAVLSMTGTGADPTLTPEYPGITESTKIADWDPPFPIDLKQIRPVDEEYWNKYRAAPKAFIDLNRGQQLWGSRNGNVTSLRFTRREPESSSSNSVQFADYVRSTFDPIENGFYVTPVKSQALTAAAGVTDFGEYFVYFSFFVVVSALLLTGLFFKLGTEQRGREIGLLRCLGFSQSKILSLFFFEGSMLSLTGSALGLLGARAYAGLMLLGLRTWWIGAIGTTDLVLHLSASSLLIGAAAGFIASIAAIAWTIRKLGRLSPRRLMATVADYQRPGRRPSNRITGYLVLVIGLIVLAGSLLKIINQVPGFFGAGTTLLIAGLLFLTRRLSNNKRNVLGANNIFGVWRLGFRSSTFRPGRSILCIALIASSTFIIVAVDAFRHGAEVSTEDKKSGTGGYPLLAESVLPIVYDLNTDQGKKALNLQNDSNTQHAFAQFRLRPGDDTSCLNLYQPVNPTILGATDSFIKSGRFSFRNSQATSFAEKDNPWLLLSRTEPDGSIPIIADANSLEYTLHLKPGESLGLPLGNGRTASLRVIAALQDSLFQSEVLMSESNFLKLFPEQAGYRFFLIDIPNRESSALESSLEDRLSDFGFDVQSAPNRLAAYHKVENTYLFTFQSLGGLGLLLGTVGLAVVLFRNVLERKGEFALLRAIGYNRGHIAKMVVAENAFLLICGLSLGAFCAFVAIAPALIARGAQVPIFSTGLLLLVVVAVGLTASLVAAIAAIRLPLLSTLGAE